MSGLRWSLKELDDYQRRMKTGEPPKAARNRLVQEGQKRANKYAAERAQAKNGAWCDSKKEARRYDELLLEISAGVVRDLRHHVPFPLVVNGVKIGRYEADFVYKRLISQGGEEAWAQVVEDVKSEITRKNPVYRIKKKLMLALHEIDIAEV